MKMKNTHAFSACHPIVNFLYFAFVLVFTMFFTHPVSLCISLGTAAAYALYLNGKNTMGGTLKYMLPMALMAAVLNPLFNHRGVTVLCRLPSGNPLTLESILYGLVSAAMLAAVILWFSCYHTVMTSDKFLYLFGRLIPSLSLVLSMTLRFVPKFTAQLRRVREAQRYVGRDIGSGSARHRLKNAVTLLGILVTWSLENAMETADSMKCRGYGLAGRTAFSIFRFDRRDRCMLFWLCFCFLCILFCWMFGGAAWEYFPTLEGSPPSPLTVSFQLLYLALCVTPLILDLWEDGTWKRSHSEM